VTKPSLGTMDLEQKIPAETHEYKLLIEFFDPLRR
jgi:hypothetical protein